MYDPVPDILTKLSTISGLSLSEGMPDFFISGDSEQMDWTTNKAIGWLDVQENRPEHILRTQTTFGMATTEKISKVIISFTYYASNGLDIVTVSDAIDQGMVELGYKRTYFNSGKEALGQTQAFNRARSRYEALFDLHA